MSGSAILLRYGSALGFASLVATSAAAPGKAQSVPAHPPMVFYVAKGGPDACGKNCSEWIASEGPIGIGTAARLRAFLAQKDRQNLPVFFESGGGSIDEAFKVGRILRQKGISAGIGRTRPEACSNNDEKSCIELKKSGKTLASELLGDGARCSSTCVYAFVGAKERKAWPSRRIGVHSTQLAHFYPDGRVKMVEMATATPEQKRQLQKYHSELQNYFREMGIVPRLADLIQSVPFQQIRYLTREELAEFGIDPGQTQ
jgi:hypothetical protein